MKRSFFSVEVLGFVLAFLYIPIVLVVVYGFVPNGISMSFFGSDGQFLGFSAKWYSQIFSGHRSVDALMQSFWLSLIVGSDTTAIGHGLIRMSCTTLFYFIAAINGVYASAILAHGYSAASAINSIFSVFVFRIIWMQVLYPHFQTFLFVMACFVVSWGIRMLVNIVLYGSIWHRYRKKTALLPLLPNDSE